MRSKKTVRNELYPSVSILCSECTLHCLDFIEDVCSVKNKLPYVCNGCGQLPKCTLLKRIYDLADAHEKARHAISEARTGILSNEDDIARINRIISPLVKNRAVNSSDLPGSC